MRALTALYLRRKHATPPQEGGRRDGSRREDGPNNTATAAPPPPYPTPVAVAVAVVVVALNPKP